MGLAYLGLWVSNVGLIDGTRRSVVDGVLDQYCRPVNLDME